MNLYIMSDNFFNLMLFKYIFRCVYRFFFFRLFRGSLMDWLIFIEIGLSMRMGLVFYNLRFG